MAFPRRQHLLFKGKTGECTLVLPMLLLCMNVTSFRPLIYITRHGDPFSALVATMGAMTDAETECRQVQRGFIRSILLVFSVTFATVVNDANASAFALALPTIQKEMQLQQMAPQLQWIVSGYPLTCGCSLLVCGRLADLYGKKKTFLIGSLILVGATLGCAFSNNVLTLNILRGAQGIGAAAQIPSSLGILSDAFTQSRPRRIAFATFSAGAAVGAVLGTAVNGGLTEYTSQTWRSTCYLLACMSMASFMGGLLLIDADKPSEEKDRRVDWFGSLLVTAGLVQVIYALSQGELAKNKWRTPYVVITLICGFLCSIGFLCWQYYLEMVQSNGCSCRSFFISPPLLKLSIWSRANGRLSAMMLIAFLNWGSFLAWMFWVQLYFQNYKHFGPLQAAILLLPMFFSGIVCNIFVVFMAPRIPLVWMLGIGTVATTVACLLFAIIIPDATYWTFTFLASLLSSMGADIISSVGTLFIAKVVLPQEQSVAAALFITMTQLGTAVGVTISTVVSNVVATQGMSDPMSIYRAAQWTAFGFGAFASVMSIITFRGIGLVDSPHTSSKKDSRQIVLSSKSIIIS